MAITREELEAAGKPPQEITWERYLDEFLNEPPTTQRYDIIEGIRVFMSAPQLLHQLIQMKIAVLLYAYQMATQQGIAVSAPFDIVIRRVPRLHTRQPDLFYISNPRLEKAGGIVMQGPMEGTPELVIEILSPSETASGLKAKLEDYYSIGVEECWLVSPESETVQLRRWTPNGYETAAVVANGQSLTSLVFPDLTIALSDIFAE